MSTASRSDVRRQKARDTKRPVGVAGEMRVDWGDGVTPRAAADVAISILMGPIAEGAESWPPAWPLDPDVDGDEGQLATLLAYLKFDGESEYRALVREARVLARTAEFRRVVWLTSRALELKDELDADDLRRLLGEKTLTNYGIPTRDRSEDGIPDP